MKQAKYILVIIGVIAVLSYLGLIGPILDSIAQLLDRARSANP